MKKDKKVKTDKKILIGHIEPIFSSHFQNNNLKELFILFNITFHYQSYLKIFFQLSLELWHALSIFEYALNLYH